ncbi:OmpH family outer membrane protein [Cytophagaceae bacterium ABcell3]|nr:OmpH family outer membrane protein [Cytophagaceae bacterium ABcell3]
MKIISYASLCLAVIALALVLVQQFSKPKIGFVRSHDLLENYAGTQDAYRLLDEFQASGSKGLDSLQASLSIEVENYKRDSIHYSTQEKISKREKIRSLQYALYQKQKSAEEEYEKRDQQLSLGILNSVSDFVSEYGEANGYDIIFSTSEGGAVLYGNDMFDLTEPVLRALNKKYSDE